MRGRSENLYFQGGAYPMRGGGVNFLGGGLYPPAYYGPVTCNTGMNKLR